MDARHKSHGHPVRISCLVREPLRAIELLPAKTSMAGTSPAMTVLRSTVR
jgi:hypothetical protein